jgi:hypothetical protein
MMAGREMPASALVQESPFLLDLAVIGSDSLFDESRRKSALNPILGRYERYIRHMDGALGKLNLKGAATATDVRRACHSHLHLRSPLR